MPTFQNVSLNAVSSVPGWDGKWRSNDLAGQKSAIIFETDFSQDAGYYKASNGGNWEKPVGANNVPNGFTTAIATGASDIAVHSGEGVDGSNALRIRYDPNLGQPTVTLAKHLTGDVNTGYDEVYVRFKVRLPAGFQMNSSGFNVYWKWLRLWQNTSPDDSHGDEYRWQENRVNAGYLVSNFGGGDGPTFGTALNTIFAGSSADPQNPNTIDGSAGGYQASMNNYNGRPPNDDYSNYPGYFERIWPIDWAVGANQGKQITPDSTWHTVEYRWKLASSPTAQDGEYQFWFDGVEQTPYGDLSTNFADGYPAFTGIPTPNMGSGINWVSFFDNCIWFTDSAQSLDETGCWVNDLVVSGQRIGHDYVVGS